MKEAATTIGVVIVTYNSEQMIGHLLDSLPEALAGHSADIVVVDNNSTDATADLVEARGGCHVLRSPNVGYAAAINRAVRHFDGVEAILVLNPDVVLTPGSVKILLDAIRDAEDEPGVVMPRLIDETGTTLHSIRREPSILNAVSLPFATRTRFHETVHSVEQYLHPSVVDWATGAVMLITPACFRQLGGFDESFFLYSEETDFCLRARDRGWPTLYLPSATAIHSGAGSGFSIDLHGLQQVNRVRLYCRRHSLLKGAVFHALVVLAEISWIVRRKSTSARALMMLLDPTRRLVPTAEKELT